MTNENTSEQYRQFIERLKREEHRSSALNDLKNLITFKPASETTSTMRSIGISKIVQCLNVNVKADVDLTCELLKMCFEKFDTGDVVKNYTSHIMYLLRHEKSCVRRLAIDENAICRGCLEAEETVSHVLLECTGLTAYWKILLDTRSLPEACECPRRLLCFWKELGWLYKPTHPHVLDSVNKTLLASPDLLPMSQYIDVFVACAQMVADPDIGVANVAISITSNLPHDAYRKILDEMKIALEYDTSSKCNAYEVIVNISAKSFDLFNLCIEMGYIDSMVSELQSRDALYQLNILELLSRLAVKPYGITHLVRHGALNRIAEYIGDLRTNPLGGLLIPGYLKFFGCVAHHYPKEIIEKYPVLLDCLFDAIDSRDPSVLPVALDTLRFIGTTIEGKLSLASVGSRYTQTVQKVGEIIKNSPTEMKVRALYCFSSLISVENDPNAPRTGPIDHRATLMTREWFRSLSTTPPAMEILFNNCKSPFPDIKMAAFSVLDALCQHQWGQELVARTAGCIEYLLDRTLDHTKESKEAKYDIIKRLSRSAAFDANTLMRLQTYVEQGPFYSERDLIVAMDEGEN